MDRIKHRYFLLNDKLLETGEFDQEIINHGTTIYELLKIRECTPLFLEKYLRRIHSSLNIIGRSDWISDAQIVEKMRLVIQKNCVRHEDHLKILISFDNDLFSPPRDLITMFFTTVPIPRQEQYRQGVRTVSLNATRYLPNAKIYQPRLRQVTEEMIDTQNIYEVILLNESNYITEGSRSNIFFIDRGKNLITPSLEDVLPGITRRNVIEIAHNKGINFIEKKVHYDELSHFEAAFLTGTSRKILPIQSIDNHVFNPQNILLTDLMLWYEQMLDGYVRMHKNKFEDICQC